MHNGNACMSILDLMTTCRGEDRAGSYLGRARSTLDNAFGSAKDDAERTKEDAKDSWGRTKSQARGAWESTKDNAEDLKDDAKDSWYFSL